jgi:hypothetical protein
MQGTHAEPTDVKSKIKAFIGHHVLDSHDFHLQMMNRRSMGVAYQLFYGMRFYILFLQLNFTTVEYEV